MSNDNKPSTVNELVRHLADTLVTDEVMKPMEEIGWNEGTPPAPKFADNPQAGEAPPSAALGTTQSSQGQPLPAAPVTVPAAKTDAPQDVNAMYESMREANGLILGKYPTVADAIKGVGHAVSMAKSAFSQRDQLQKDLDRLSEELKQVRQTPPAASPVAAPSQSLVRGVPSQDTYVKAQANYDAVLSQIVADGGILDSENVLKLSAAQRELSESAASYAAEKSLLQKDAAGQAENEKWSAVDAYMDERYPDAKNFSDEIALFVQSDPLIAEAISAFAAKGKEKEATEFAWKQFNLSRGVATTIDKQAADQVKEIHLQAADQVRKEAVAQARMDAGVMTTSATGAHEAPAAPSRAEIEAAAAAMRAYGIQPGNPGAARWRELTIGKDLPNHIFGL